MAVQPNPKVSKPDMLNYTQQKKITNFVLGVLLLISAVIFAFPFYWLFVSAFKTRDQIFASPPQLFPQPFVHTNFVDIFTQTRIFRSFINSSIIAAGHVFFTLFLCSLGGYAFAKYKKAPGRDALFAFVMATMMIPGAVTLIPVFLVLTELGWVNTYWALIIPGTANAFGIFWMRQYITAFVPDDLLAAARIDGCSEFGIYWRVVLPICVPPLSALGILSLIGSWNNLMMAFIVMRTEDMYTMPLWIYILQGEQTVDYGLVMAGGLMTTLPLVIAFLFFQRGFINGITAGAIKQ